MSEEKYVGELVVRSVARDAGLEERYRAFEELVRRFQDMAFACAYGRVGDRGLAEDAAQEAFVTAWLKLDQLRTPEAFPGWFRRILMRECGRIAGRNRQLEAPPAMVDRAADDGDPASRIEQGVLGEELRRSIEALPDHERVTVLLFYMGEHSLKDVATFLGVSANLVKQRLYSARQRLKRRLETAMGEELHRQRPSRDEKFAARVRLRLQRFDRDYAGLKDLVERAEAKAPAEHLDVVDDQLEWLANRERFDAEGMVASAYVVEGRKTGERLAYGCIERVDPPISGDYPPTGRPGESTYRVHLIALPGAIEAGVAGPLYGRLEKDALALKATRLWCRDTSEHMDVVGALLAAGFREQFQVHEWHVAVDGWRTPRQRQIPSAVAITTLAEEGRHGRDCVEALHRFWDAPGSKTAPDEAFSYDDIEQRLSKPDIVRESFFLAKASGTVVGVLVLRRPPESTPSKLDMHFRVLDEALGKGIEERLLTEAVAYARRSGRETLTAYFRDGFNDREYLEGLGLRRSVDLIVLEKALADAGATAPRSPVHAAAR